MSRLTKVHNAVGRGRTQEYRDAMVSKTYSYVVAGAIILAGMFEAWVL